jgi:uncharacterized protein YjbI with pentapeptide repeats
MNDDARPAIDEIEAPVNPYGLLAAINPSSRTAHVSWLLFVSLMGYLFIAVAGITHRDLLLNGDVTLPLLQTHIGLTRFFVIVPILVVLAHTVLLIHLALLARRMFEFNAAVRFLEGTDQRTHPLRLELDSFFFVQAIAGPERSRVLTAFLNGLSWLSLAILPLALLLFVQLTFLPFHAPAITMTHRLTVLADILVLLMMGVFLARPETTYFGAFGRTALYAPGSLAFGMAVLVAGACVSAFATLPQNGASDDPNLTRAPPPLFGIFPRSLEVTDADLVPGTELTRGARTINLRDRDLRFARLDRSDLHQADFRGANLDGASLVETDLRRATFACEGRADLNPTESRSSGSCASARSANFAKARLDAAELTGVDLRQARFDRAALYGADLGKAQAAGVDFSSAELRGANLAEASLQGANFQQANLQGADLAGARLQMSDLSGAAMQAAVLTRANVAGAQLRETALAGVTLHMAKLFAADLRGANLDAADLSGAMVWRTVPPGSDSATNADLSALALNPPSQEDMNRMQSAVEGLDTGADKIRLAALVAPLNDAAATGAWASSPEAQAWAGLAKASEAAMAEGYRARLADHLARLACSAPSSGGAVAVGIARRAIAPGFKGDVAALYDRLKGQDCPGAAALPTGLLRDLAAVAEAARRP